MGHMAGMWIFWLLFLVLLVVLVLWVVRATARGRGSAGPERPGSSSAEDILRERYARGEIDKEEFQARLGDLRG